MGDLVVFPGSVVEHGSFEQQAYVIRDGIVIVMAFCCNSMAIASFAKYLQTGMMQRPINF